MTYTQVRPIHKQIQYFDRNRRNSSRTPGETETTAMVWSPPKDASPPAATTGVEKLAIGQEEETWMNLTPLDRHYQLVPVQDHQLEDLCI